MFAIVMLVLLVSLGMLILRTFLGSSAFDRILAMNSITTHVIVLVVLLGFLKNTNAFVDVAIIYGLIGFVTVIAFLMYFKYKPEE